MSEDHENSFPHTNIEIAPGKIIGEGSEGSVKESVVKVKRGNKERTLNLAYKEMKDPRMPTEIQVERYRESKKVGLPVPTTFRGTQDGNILMTDLTSGGKNIVLSVKDIKEENSNSPNLLLFKSLPDISKTLEVKTKVKEYAIKAANAGLRFYYDCWFIVISPDGSYNFVLGDFGNLDKPKSKIWSFESLRDTNEGVMDTILLSFSRLQGYNLVPTK